MLTAQSLNPQVGAQAAAMAARSASDDAQIWAAFGGAKTASEFCVAWLSIQCRMEPFIRSALLLIEDRPGHYATAAAFPDMAADLSHLAPAAEKALRERRGLVHKVETLPGETGSPVSHIAYPVDVGGHLHGVVVLDVGASQPAELTRLMRHLHWGVGWLETLFRRRQADESLALAQRTGFALDMLAGASEHRSLNAAGLAFVNDLSTRLNCRRVSLGLLDRQRIGLIAVSHSAVFQERTHTVSMIESAMEEAIDQGLSVCLPENELTAKRITLAHHDLSRHAGAQSIVSVILTSAARPVGVVTLERDKGEIFDIRTVQLLEAVAVLVGPLFELKHDANRLVAGRIADQTGSLFTKLFGRRHPALKLAALFLVAGLAALVTLRGPLRVSSKGVVEGMVQRAAVAAFDGFIGSAAVRAGDTVKAGQELARLDDHDLKLEALRWRSQYEQQVLKYDEALGKHDRAQMRIAQAARDEAKAQLLLVEDKIARSLVTAPFDGLVVSGDLSQTIGSPVEKGKVLFELAPLDGFRVALDVDERDIDLVEVGQTGELATTGLSGDRFPLVVSTIMPVATSSEGHTFFRVEAKLSDPDKRLRPGMEGVGKITIAQRSYFDIWTRSLVDWARITAWKYWP